MLGSLGLHRRLKAIGQACVHRHVYRHVYRHMYGHVYTTYAGMCIDICIGMCIDMMSRGHRSGMCADTRKTRMHTHRTSDWAVV